MMRILYTNNLKIREFGKEAPQIFCPARVALFKTKARARGKKYGAKVTLPKTEYSNCLCIALIFLTTSVCAFAEYTLKDGKLVEKEQVATESVQEHFSGVLKAHETESWDELEKQTQIVINNFPSTPFARDAAYFLAVAHFKRADYELANTKITEYLRQEATPKYFEEAIRYKFEIAEQFRGGARKHLMGLQSLPKWAPAREDAIAIYDEVISALPHNELAAQALFGKAQVLLKEEDFRAAVEAYQTLIRRFSKHSLAVESYIGVGEIYLIQSQDEYPDPDFLDLAELNVRKFKASFPSEEKLSVALGNLKKMKDHYATSLFETAQFYERTDRWGAAKMYYSKILVSFPESPIADKSRKRLEVATTKHAQIEAKKNKNKT